MTAPVSVGLRRGWRPKQPLLSAALFFAFGIVLQSAAVLPPDPTLFLAAGGAAAWFLISRRTLLPPWPIAPLLVTAGMMSAAARMDAVRDVGPGSLHALVLRVPQHVALRGMVATDPAWRESAERPAASKKAHANRRGVAVPRAEFTLRVSAVRFHTRWEPARGLVLVRLPFSPARAASAKGLPPASLEFGQTIEIEGALDHPREARNFDLFDYAEYLARQGIGFVLSADESDEMRWLGAASGWGWLFRARSLLARRLTLGIERDPLACGIIRGMLLGYREDIPPDVNESFRRTGTLHVFAISGSHITAISCALLVVLRLFRVPRAAACWIVLPLLAFYVAATGLRASAIRSLLMAGIVIAGWAIGRPSALLNNLAAAALVVLAADPLQLYDAGFQLSFGVVAALIFLAPAFDQRLRRVVEPDPWIPRKLIPRWRSFLRNPIRWGAAFAAVSLAAWIGSLGLNIHYFNLVSFVALLANLLIVPLAGASVALGLASVALGVLGDDLGIALNTAHALLIHLMTGISAELGAWRVGCFYVARPPVAWTLAGYALLAAAAALWLDGRRRRALAVLGAMGGLIAVAAAFAWHDPRLRVDVLDVGVGQAALITGPRFERILVDAGSRSAGRNTVLPFLRARGVNALDLAVITHGDAGHYGGIETVLDALPARRVAVASATFRSKGYQSLLKRLEARGLRIERWREGESATLRSGRLTALWPPEEFAPARADDGALVLRLESAFGDLLFASDLGSAVERALAAAGRLRPCRLIVQGPPSAEDDQGDAFLSACRPEAVVVNTAEFPFRALPTPALRERWRAARLAAFPTDERGGVLVRLGPEGMTLVSKR